MSSRKHIRFALWYAACGGFIASITLGDLTGGKLNLAAIGAVMCGYALFGAWGHARLALKSREPRP